MTCVDADATGTGGGVTMFLLHVLDFATPPAPEFPKLSSPRSR